MIVAKIKVDGVSAKTAYLSDVPAGIIGAQVEIEYTDAMWSGLSKTVVFRGCCTKDVTNAGASVIIPADVVAKPGARIMVGVYGVDADNNLAIPTLWAPLGVTLRAADPSGDESTDPSLPVWAQLDGRVTDLEKNPVDKEQVEAIVQDYVAENPAAPGPAGPQGEPGEQGPQGPQGIPGDDYVLTDADMQKIAERAAGMVEVPDSGQNVELDTTLTQSGKAADAAAVGAALKARVKTVNGAAPDESGNVEIEGSITDEEKTLILALFKNATYISADMAGTLAQLEELWGVTEEEEPHTHSYASSVTTAATCETAGVRTYTCSCGNTYTEEIPATGHNYVDGVCTICGAADPDYVEPTDGWSYSINQLNVLKCATGSDVTGEICLNMSTGQQNKRRSYLLTSGAKCCKKTTDTDGATATWEDSEFYPIPIPDTATYANIAISPSTQYVAYSVWDYDPSSNTYTKVQDPGWKQGGHSANFVAKANRYLSVVSKYDNTGNQYPVEPTALTVTFGATSGDEIEPNEVWLPGCSSSTVTSSNNTAVIYNNNNARATYVAQSGAVGLQYFDNTNYSDSPYYPVLIPAGATKVTAVCEGFTWGIAYLKLVNGKWTRTADPGWQTLGGSTHEITDGTAEAVFINLKKGTAGTESITSVPDTVTITFE